MARSKSPYASLATIAAAAAVALAPCSAAAQLAASSADPSIVRGVVRSIHQAMISTELQVRVSEIAKREGEAFTKGDVLVELDCRRQRAELASAEAQLLEMKLTLDNNKVLRQAQAVGKHDLDISQARVAKAAAEAEALRVRIDQCKLVAPFDGHVLELAIYPHETTQPGKPFIGLVAHGALEIDLIVPADWLQRVRVGTKLMLTIDELKVPYRVSVVRIGAAVDPVSQTVKIFAAFADAQLGTVSGVLPGMSGTAELLEASE